MPDVDLPVALVAALALLAIGGAYYAILMPAPGAAGATASDRSLTDPPTGSAAGPPARWTMAAEAFRCLVLGGVLSALAGWADVGTWAAGLGLGALLWLGFPFVLWAGAVVHESTPIRLAALHAGDWLVKLLVVGMLVGAVR
jgi:hypothetical protein